MQILHVVSNFIYTLYYCIISVMYRIEYLFCKLIVLLEVLLLSKNND